LASLITGETLRVLLVSAREEARDEVGQALAGRAGDHRLYWVSQPDLAATRAEDLLPHVILVDEALGNANPGALIGQLAGRLPRSAVLALVSAGNLDLAQRAVLAGARGFVTRPLQQDDFLTALRQVLAQRKGAPVQAEEGPASGKIVAFCAPKGGTGRTTLTINTTISLQRITGQPAVLVDADFSAPALDVALNLPAARNIGDLLPKVARLDQDAVASVLAKHASGVRVLLAPPSADLANPIRPQQVQQVLVWLKRMFGWVVVDLGLPMDETAFAFLDGADRIVMTVLPEMVGLRNTRLMLDQFRQRGYPEEKTWLVLNRAAMKAGVSVADIEERLRVKVRYRIPDDQPLATHSINRGVPIVMSHPKSAVARAVNGFARDLAGGLRTQAPDTQEAKAAGGLLGRLRGRARPAGVS
jgi:pilus assembly protein CpaE